MTILEFYGTLWNKIRWYTTCTKKTVLNKEKSDNMGAPPDKKNAIKMYCCHNYTNFQGTYREKEKGNKKKNKLTKGKEDSEARNPL